MNVRERPSKDLHASFGLPFRQICWLLARPRHFSNSGSMSSLRVLSACASHHKSDKTHGETRLDMCWHHRARHESTEAVRNCFLCCLLQYTLC